MNLFINKDTKLKIQSIDDQMVEIYKIADDINNELKKSKKISKHESTKNLMTLWEKENKIIQGFVAKVKEHEAEFHELLEKNKIKRAKEYADEIEEKLADINNFLLDFLEKLEKFTGYEYDSVKIAINLKERLKEVNLLFDQNLKFLDIYNTSFIESVSIINYKISEFEDLQSQGEYPKARESLKIGHKILTRLEKQCISVIDDQQKNKEIEKNLDEIAKIKEFMVKENYDKYGEFIEKKIDRLNTKYEQLKENLQNIKFLKESNVDYKELAEEINKFDETIQEELSQLREQKSILKKIIKTKNTNSNLMEIFENLIEEALEEKKVILNLYRLENSESLNKIEKEEETYNKFQEDYQRLLDLIGNEGLDFSPIYKKIKQSNLYLNKILENLRGSIKLLEAIRHDEIEALENLNKYQQEMIKIDIYIRQNHHYETLNRDLKELRKEINKKINELLVILEQEVLEISLVRTIDGIINEMIEDFISRVQTDIKQKRGSEKLILYFNKSINNEEGIKYSERFLKLYRNAEYRKILKEIYKILKEKDDRGEQIYKNIVNTVVLEQYRGSLN